MKNRYIIVAVIGVLLVLPLLLIPLSIFVAELFMAGGVGAAWDRTWDTMGGMLMIEYIGLHSAVTGIVVILCFPFVFYKLHKKVGEHRKQEEFNRKKQMLHDVLHRGMIEAMKSQQDEQWETFNFTQVTDNHIEMLSQVDSLFSEKQAFFLRQKLELLKEISQQADRGEISEVKQSVDELIELVAVPDDAKHQASLQNDRDLDETLNEKTLTILQLLSEETDKPGIGTDITYQNSGA